MRPVESARLHQLVEHWRAKNSRLQEKYAKQAPVMMDHISSAIEACAQDLELVILEVQPQPQPKLSKQ